MAARRFRHVGTLFASVPIEELRAEEAEGIAFSQRFFSFL